MRALRGADEDAWGNVALLHDFDYERHPTLDQHPQDGAPHLRELGYPEWFVRAVLSHANHLQDVAARESELERVLFACDELAGFVHACGLVRPEGLSTLEPRSVRKKLKQKSFAAGVNRDDVYAGAEGLGRRPRRPHPGRDRRAQADQRRARPARVTAGGAAA